MKALLKVVWVCPGLLSCGVQERAERWDGAHEAYCQRLGNLYLFSALGTGLRMASANVVDARASAPDSAARRDHCAHAAIALGDAAGYLWAVQELPTLMVTGAEEAEATGLIRNDLAGPLSGVAYEVRGMCLRGDFEAAEALVSEAVVATHALVEERRAGCVAVGVAVGVPEGDIAGFPIVE